MQGELPAVLPVLLGGDSRGLHYIFRYASQRAAVGDVMGEGIGRVQQVVIEARGELVELLSHLLELGLLIRRQLGTAEAEVAQLIVYDLPLGGVEAGEFGARRATP